MHSVAIIHVGDARDPWAWSGTPAGLAKGLQERGFKTRRMSSDLPGRGERLSGAAARRLPGNVNGNDAGWLVAVRERALRARLERSPADCVIAMGSTFGRDFAENARLLTYEDMTVAQSPFPDSLGKRRWVKRQRELYERADLCCVTTPWVADSLVRDYGVAADKIVIAGLGANVPCTPVEKDWGTPRILWVGVDWHRKGGDLLLEAFREAAIPGATLDLVGRHPDIDDPRVRGHGLVRDPNRLRPLFESATLFALPSRFDPSPIVFLEAASAGTPCIGTDTGGTAYNVGPSGVTIPADNVGALTEAIQRLTDPEVAAQYRTAAIGHARSHTWSAVARRIMDRLELT